MSVTLQVKAYLFPDYAKPSANAINQCTEIRRFLLSSSGWRGIYQELTNKIGQSFTGFIPEGEKAAICTYYLDEEAELIGFSSDEEMQYANDVLVALGMSSKSFATPPHVFKVYVASKATAKKATGVRMAVHPGVICDGCNDNKPIAGCRFKCAVCPDFDLCLNCEQRGIHKETGHTFIRLETPMHGRCPRRGYGYHNHPGSLFGQNLSQMFPIVNNPEELKRFGAHLKNVLEPFGIDVDYFVDNCTRSTAPTAENNKNEKEESKPPQAEAPSTTKPADQSEDVKASSSSHVDKKEEHMHVDSDPTVPTVPTPGAQAQAENPFLQVINMMKNFNTTGAEKPSERDESASSSAPPAQVDDGFVNVDTEFQKEMKIIRALESLKQMGYNDDSGWLTRLAIAKEGNLNLILDAISPK